MSLIIANAFQQTANKQNVDVYDITGTGTNGYGNGGNPAVGDFVTCSAEWYFPDATTKQPSAAVGATIDMYPTLPNITGAKFTTTSVALLGSAQNLPNGIYRCVITQGDGTTDPATEYTSDTKFPVIASVRCCINNLVLVADSCTCKGKSNIKLLEAKMFLDQMYVKDRSEGEISDGETCNMWNKMAEIIIDCEAICANANCDSCNAAKCC